MLRNYLKIGWRNLMRSKGFSAINILGLAMGMTVAILIGLWVWDELSFDRTHTKKDRIVQVMQHLLRNGQKETQGWNPYPLGDELRNNYGSDFEKVAQTKTTWDILAQGNLKTSGEGRYCEAEMLDILTFDILAGSDKALDEPYSIMLSESMAASLFGQKDPIGKPLNINDQFEVKVTAVYKDFPDNSTFKPMKYVMPWKLFMAREEWLKTLPDPWRPNFAYTYALMPAHSDLVTVSEKIKDARQKHLNEELALQQSEVFLFPMSRWHLYEKFENGVNAGGSIQYVWLFGIVGLFVLALASINFMNLYTAQAEKKAREVGVRKAIGSKRDQLIFQYLSESVLTTCLSLAISLLLVPLFLGGFNEIAGKEIQFPYSSPGFWAIVLGFSFLVGVLSGSYPAIYLSSFAPVKVLKGTFKAGKYAALPRKALVVVQFTVSIALIISTLIILQQIRYAKQRPLGYGQSNLIYKGSSSTSHQKFDAIKNELQSLGYIENMAESSAPPTWINSTTTGIRWSGRDLTQPVEVPYFGVSVDYGKTIDWQIVEGRDFSRDFDDEGKTFIVNEAAARMMGFEQTVGQILHWGDTPFTVIGVVKDMVVESPFSQIHPMFYALEEGQNNQQVLKLAGNRPIDQSLAGVQSVFEKFDPETPFNYEFVEVSYAQKFDTINRLSKLINIFASLAIFISCLGLFGLASYMTAKRAKEIGVRKVLGATVSGLWIMLSKDFLLLILISLVIAAPLAAWFMGDWLTSFDYHASIAWWTFAVTGLGAFIIALITVSYQSIKAALLNPVKSLRSE